jgi:hypothetical protein
MMAMERGGAIHMSTCTPIPTRRLSLEAIDDNDIATSKLVDMVLLLAINDLATDVVFEPRRDDYRLSYRCAGQDYDMAPPPLNRAGRISQVFKTLAHLDIRNRRTPQDGMVRCLVDDEGADILISIRPTTYGESIYLTIHNNTTKLESAKQVIVDGTNGPDQDIEVEKEEIEYDWTNRPELSMRSSDSENASFCHRLVMIGGAKRGEWTLEWDAVSFFLSDPNGVLVLESLPHHAGWCVDFFQLYESNQIWFYAQSLDFLDSGIANELALDRNNGVLKFKKKRGCGKRLAHTL